MIPLRLLLAVSALFTTAALADTIPLSDLDLGNVQQDYEKPGKNVSLGRNPLTLGGQTFASGVGTHASSSLIIDLKKAGKRFTATVGVDDEVGKKGSVEFIVLGDKKVLWKSGILKGGDAAKKVDVALADVSLLQLRVTDGEDGNNSDHADWADAKLEFQGTQPQSVGTPVRPAVVLTPKVSPQPRVNGPAVFGVRPGSPFLYTIPATGTRPMTFAADGLPAGLKLDVSNGRITGMLPTAGEFHLILRTKNALGAAEKKFRIVVGEEIALTPPMGWNSWNCWGEAVDQEKVFSSARALIAAGLDQHGWTYINIDDTWQGERGGPFHGIQTNEKFPNMKALCDEVHGMGLKVGIYSTPWTVSYGKKLGGSSENPEGKWNPDVNLNATRNQHLMPFDVGPYHFAKQDAQQWAAWGFDYLKYDWGPVDVANTREMGDALRASGRDVVYSLSNNAARNIQAIIGDLAPLANAWRTTGDINDSWRSMSGIGFGQEKWAAAQKPGHYNDPDMLIVGHVGWGHPHPTKLTPDEQYTHISLWCLLGAPLLIGSDLAQLDEFTLNLLTNDEVLEIDQDELCKQATAVASADGWGVYAKLLVDGSVAVGLFNRSNTDETVTAKWADLKLNGKHLVRDLWQQKDLGTFDQKFEAPVPAHGVVLVRIFPAK